MGALIPGDYTDYLSQRLHMGPARCRETYGIIVDGKLRGAAVYYDWVPGGEVWFGGAIDDLPFGSRGLVLQLLVLPYGKWSCRWLMSETPTENAKARRFLERLGMKPVDLTESTSIFPEGTVIYSADLLACVSRWGMKGA